MDGASPWLLVPPGSRLSGRCHHHIRHLPLPRSVYCGLEAPSANQTLINSNARFRGQAAKPPGSNKSPTSSTAGQQPTSPTVSHGSQSSTNLAPKVPPLPNSPSLAHSIGMDDQGSLTDGDSILNSYHLPRPMPIWLNSNYGKHIVKGNFMTLSARPKTVEQGEWIAHQVVEHYRNLWNFVRVLHEKEEDGSTICNATTCPRMSAGANHSFTWLNSRREPVELPAFEYMTLMQRWISGKIDDTNIFPTDPSGVSYAHNSAITTTPLSQLTNPGEPDWIGKRSGFPQNFIDVCQTIFRQMFRVYSHLYWAHFVEPFYHLNLEKSLNSCFSHFILTATALDMLKPHELEPMQPLIDLWAANGTFPPESKAYEYANLRAGERLMHLAGVS
ncbi:Mob1/phocein family protein [Colletotrichum higginsianum]|uniref:Mob1/phocein family protein n=2 Tax=Colletotrichum higginsianum TaxID=80884 RepID=H1VNQ5_COLHI|nr:Mob1/phocein family protein [Colletotrichum higginsianum IMI 349063]OBR15638.1 Mob1/phocein family protein [Colletotrichum higginsianum IMI 349063]CCF41859.1 Mob1/phocein family protein [Colletotrichum higginsianum]